MEFQELVDAASTCCQCDLYKNRNVPVFSKGNPKADIIICGMCPGPKENEKGVPFVGKSGQLLDGVLSDAGLSLDDVYITNIVKCFVAPGTPLKDSWIAACISYFIAEITIVNPKLLISLGADASRALLNKPLNTPMFKMRNKLYQYTHSISLLATYHPSYFVRNGGTKHIHYDRIVEDFTLALHIIKGGSI